MTPVSSRITVCIPTFRRPRELIEAVASVRSQVLRPSRILIGDDAGDVEAAGVELAAGPVPIEIIRGERLGQSGNINRLLRAVQTEWFVLLHDDDWLLENALADLWKAAESGIFDGVFGKQLLCSHRGELDRRSSEELNRAYYRCDAFAGAQLTAAEAVLVQQFPNDAYLMRTELARAVGFRELSQVGTDRWVDFDFSLRVAAAVSPRFFYVNQYVAVYRRSRDSVSTKSRAPLYLWREIDRFPVDRVSGWARRVAMRRMAPKLVSTLRTERGWFAAFAFFLSAALRGHFSVYSLLRSGLSLTQQR